MRTILVVALLLLPVLQFAPHAAAQDEIMPPQGTIWTVYNRVEATVQDNYATVNIIAEIGNEGPDPEFPFQVQVPETAFVTGMTITRDGETFEAEIKEREAARQEYEEHKANEETGGLIEKERGFNVYAFLINVAEFTSVEAVLTYEMYLASEEDVYTLPLQAPVSGFGRDLGAQFDVTITHRDGVSTAWGTGGSAQDGETWTLSHSVGQRPDDAPTYFDAMYTLNPTPAEGSILTTVIGGTGYFAHRFQAPADETELPLDIVLVLDRSGSMRGEKIMQLQDAALQVVEQLDDGDNFNIVFFSSIPQSPWEGLKPATTANKAEAIDAINMLTASGSTGIDQAIVDGFGHFQEPVLPVDLFPRSPILVFLTDGQASSGESDNTKLRELALESNNHEARVFSLAFGSDADYSLVAGLARDGSGSSLKVPSGTGAEVDLRRFMSRLTTPVLDDVQVNYEGSVQAFGATAPILFGGSELLVLGTFDASLASMTGTVTGTAHDGARSYAFDEVVNTDSASFLPRLVAAAKIRDMQNEIAAEGESEALIDDITGLALQWGFVTDYTSLVLILAPRAVEGNGWSEEAEADSSFTGSAPPRDAGVREESAGNPMPSDPASERNENTPLGIWIAAMALAVAFVLRRKRN